MGQKTSPISLRIGIATQWDASWYAARGSYADFLKQDILLRQWVKKNMNDSFISSVMIERLPKVLRINLSTSRPGVLASKKSADMAKLKKYAEQLSKAEVSINVQEVKKPDMDAMLVASNIARQIEGRAAPKRAMKRAMQSTMKMGALGIRISVSGRIGGAEIARTEKCHDGRVPLHTLKADVDYATAEAHTTYGVLGVKVWICRPNVVGY